MEGQLHVLALRSCAAVALVLLLAGTPAHATSVTRGPYLQLGTPSSVTVRWRTDVATKSQVSYGLDPGTLGENVKSSIITTEHAVKLVNLLPDRRYYYAVGTFEEILAGGDAEHHFDTPPIAGSAEPTRIWVLGDSGTANAAAAAVRDAYYDFTAGQDTDLVLMLGDNAYPMGTDIEYQVALFDMYPEMLRKTVLWPTPGNHDLFDDVNQTWPYFDNFTLPQNGEAGGVASGTEAYYSFDYGNVHFVVLDSQNSNRTPGGPMLTWLSADLSATTQEWIIAYWHHPPYSKGGHDSDDTAADSRLTEMRQFAVPILESHGVDLVLAGHSHDYERSFLIDGHYGYSGSFGPEHVIDGGDGREDGTGAYVKPLLDTQPHAGAVYAVAGSAGLTSGGSLDHPAMVVSFNLLGSVVLDVDGHRLDATFLDSAGIERDHFTIEKNTDVVADFSATPRQGGAPLTVQFTNDSLIAGTQVAWDFEDDGVVDSTFANPLHVYPAPGSYSVRLTVHGPEGTFERVKPAYIDAVLVAPQAAFTTSVSGGKAPLSVTFSDLSSHLPDGWAWDFDDDGSVDSTLQHPVHVYTTPGVYSVRLRAMNAAGWHELLAPFLITVAPELPGEITHLRIGPGKAPIVWDPLPEACSYDLVKGDLAVLQATEDLAASQIACEAQGVVSPESEDHAVPDPYQAWYYLVRGVDCSPKALTYDTWDFGQVRSRDPQLQGPTALCLCPQLDDTDADGWCQLLDNCDSESNPGQGDGDGDGPGDSCDNCPATVNGDQLDFDIDGSGDLCDDDDDADGIDDVADSCPFDTSNDLDLDAICGAVDNCPAHANTNQSDVDADDSGDVCDCQATNALCSTDCLDADLDLACVTSDCDDADPAVLPGAAPKDDLAACMKDQDGDDWGDQDPPVGVTAGTDCNDASATLSPETPWYVDADGDGYGDPTSAETSCVALPGRVIQANDCDDSDPALNPDTVWHIDADGDGHGDPQTTQVGCTGPADFVLSATDCDDEASWTYPGVAYLDDTEACMKDTDGDAWGDASPGEASIVAGTDCDDGDVAINPGTTWYFDADSDGWGDPETSEVACVGPAGFLLNGGDCDDAADDTYPGAASLDDTISCMKDADADGWGDPTPPAGVSVGTDCNDADAEIGAEVFWFLDGDVDGYGDPAESQISCVQPPGFVFNAEDCDDEEAHTFPGAAGNDNPFACMKDADSDEWGDAAPLSGVTPGTDCDDANHLTGPAAVWYADADADGFGTPSSTLTSCTQPSGHVGDSGDCNDASAATFPGAAPKNGASACMKDQDGDDWGDQTPPPGVSPGSDCNDGSAAISPETIWYRDADTDGYGTASITLASCLQPAGYVANTSDCNDASSVTFPGAAPKNSASACMKDQDGDDWGDQNPPVGVTAGTDCNDASSVTFPGAAPKNNASACMKDQDNDDWGDQTPPAGVTAGTDCNDANVVIHPDTMWYRDLDGDGFGDPSNDRRQCTQPSGYVLDNTDCRDTGSAAAATYPGAAPKDSATACMRDVDNDDWGSSNPPGSVVPGTDCNDANSTINPQTVWYRDVDGDGFGTTAVTQTACVQPSGFVSNFTDCNDASASTFPGAAPNDSASACMKDQDNDNWGDVSPPGGVSAGTDCNDGSSGTFPGAAPNNSASACMKDQDNDNWGDVNPPAGVAPGTDCDDAAVTTFPGAAPKNSFTACMKDQDNDNWGDTLPPAGVTPGTDCNDASAAINPETIWYRDVDGDGFGNASVTQVSCTQPAGYVSNSSDCNDASAVTFPGAAPKNSPTFCMKDQDGDDWGDQAPPAGVVAGSDCNDANAAISPETIWYRDLDVDGFGSANSTVAQCTQPAGYVSNSSDCDDLSVTTFPGAAPHNSPTACMKDNDADDWGSSTPPAGVTPGTDCNDTAGSSGATTFPGAAPNNSTTACMKDTDGDDWGSSTPPAGVTPGTDCNDASAAINPATIWYRDQDGDGFGNPNVTQASCTQPGGYVSNSTDCNDASSNTFPGAAPNDSPTACMKDSDGDDWGSSAPPAGVTVGTDCNDTSGSSGATTYPGAAPLDSPTACMKDTDGDNWGSTSPPAGVTPGTDCNDANSAVNPTNIWYRDLDVDGFGNLNSTVASCTQPAGYVANSTDCDDTSATTFPGAAPKNSASACMKDSDGDDWGSSTPPAGVTAGTDCNDASAAISPETVWYRDLDVDGFGNPSSTQVSCTQPAGYVANNTDCNDNSNTTFPGAAPNDSLTACMKDTDGDNWGSTTPPAGVTAGTDCNDANAAINPTNVWYRDLDVDSFGNLNSTTASCTQPAGYVSNSTDCDDTSATTFPGAAPLDHSTACMKDTDGDNWGSTTPPAGVTPGTDCNDANSAVNPTNIWYRDLDVDGFGNFNSTVASCTQPVGYVSNSTDCDDASAMTFPGAAPLDSPTACMKDTDGDNWGSSSVSGGVTPGTDCDDTNASINPMKLWYRDLDGDGFGNVNSTTASCMQPVGYVANTTDCDDASATTFPGAAPNDSPLGCMRDADGDDWGSSSVSGGVTPGSDCDDGSLVTFPGAAPNDSPTACLRDADDDNWGSSTPPGGVTPGTDCDDSSAVTFPGAASLESAADCMQDADGDNWGSSTPPGGVTPGADCDDANAAVNPTNIWYLDSDGDGFGFNSTVASCTQPAGYVSNVADCDDTSATTFPGAAPNDSPTECMKDDDGDDWGDATPPAGVTPGTDCDDADPEKNPASGCR